MAKPYHIIATPDENGYTIKIPEYPNATAHCERTEDITETGENLAMLARMDAGEPVLARCPKCGKEYSGRPALSRVDNTTPICPDCGTREALDAIGMTAEEQEKIITEIHQHI